MIFYIIGDINALVQEELSGQLKDSLKLESSPLKVHPPHHHKNENKEYQVRLLLLTHPVLCLYHNNIIHLIKIERTNIFM